VTTPPAPEPAPDGAPLERRVDSIENEQRRQGGILDQILGKLSGDNDAPVTRAADPAAAAGDMTEQMRQAVRDVRAEEAAAAKTQPSSPEPETVPREVTLKGKDRLQRALFGGDPK
jgi:hypothetical protein